MTKSKLLTSSQIAALRKGFMDDAEKLLVEWKLTRLRAKLHLKQAIEGKFDGTNVDVAALIENQTNLIESCEKRIPGLEKMYFENKRDYLNYVGSVSYRAEQKFNKVTCKVKSWFKKNPAPAQATV